MLQAVRLQRPYPSEGEVEVVRFLWDDEPVAQLWPIDVDNLEQFGLQILDIVKGLRDEAQRKKVDEEQGKQV